MNIFTFRNSDQPIERIVFAVNEQLNLMERAEDIFIYGLEKFEFTPDFYYANKEDILTLLNERAAKEGKTIFEEINEFGTAREVKTAEQLENLLCRYAVEEAAEYFINYRNADRKIWEDIYDGKITY